MPLSKMIDLNENESQGCIMIILNSYTEPSVIFQQDLTTIYLTTSFLSI